MTVKAGEPTNPLNNGEDIAYLYLTFERTLPQANTTILHHSTTADVARGKEAQAHAPPDLSPYENPMGWPGSRKYLMLFLSCIATFLTAYTSGSYSPPLHLMETDLGVTSDVAVLAGITTFCAGFAFAPMVLAPLSEMNGRYPLFVAAGTVYVIFQAVCGVVRTLAGMLVARFLVGVGASVFSTMVGGVIADMWDKEGRNTPMALFSGSVLVGTGAGPLVAAVMAHRLGEGRHAGEHLGNATPWKWVFWHQVIAGAVVMLALVVLFRESRGSVLLSRKARALNKWYEQLEAEGFYGIWLKPEPGESLTALTEQAVSPSLSQVVLEVAPATWPLRRIRWLVKEDEERSSVTKMITISVYRPFLLLCTESVIFFFSLWVAFAWGVLYLTFASIPITFQRQYNWSIEQAGYVFTAMMVGAVLATVIGIWQEKILHHPYWAAQPPSSVSDLGGTGATSAATTSDSSDGEAPPPAGFKHPRSGTDEEARGGPFWHFIRQRFPADAPESRLYFTLVTSTFLPAGLFVFGFTARPDTHWIAPSIGIALATMGILSIYLAVFNYFADTYGKFASSALAAQSFCRNILGGVFPLVTGVLFRNLGEARAGGLLGAIATALTAVPWVLVFFGERIRARSPFACVSPSFEFLPLSCF
ncbi:major facilitator superfamily domain-containing protein [Lasiosphaeria miniovina]|uniref:Major facilitator superfamily domain-containing protein n=1 Tax=Lasiosphaeria miniovina TaxID=1954250 RepID=A0AA40DTG8_9PEZI|nr:major facilitator superfamily domain-containing protein [Lasiosphaeria miniovina]KAK0712836.1 major facilitator superfamily domain-containing protein [Lasiosphaeria miniovina]